MALNTKKNDKQELFLIVGPTASGKTAVSVEVASRMNAEIISADSFQIYRELDIGSAKPNAEERRGIAHHAMDCVSVFDEPFNVSAYRALAVKAIGDIISRGRRPLVVGGTGLYVNSLIFPLDFSLAEPDPALRESLALLESSEPGALHKRLAEIDPESAGRLHKNDTKRIIRAIEVFEKTGRTLSAHGGDFANSRGREIDFLPRIAGITMDRERLYARIDSRVELMLDAGLLDEVDALIGSGAAEKRTLPAFQGLGYKELIAYRLGELGYNEAVELIKRDTRRFAKRQISWFKRDDRIRWFDADALGDGLSDAILRYFEGEELGRTEP